MGRTTKYNTNTPNNLASWLKPYTRVQKAYADTPSKNSPSNTTPSYGYIPSNQSKMGDPNINPNKFNPPGMTGYGYGGIAKSSGKAGYGNTYTASVTNSVIPSNKTSTIKLDESLGLSANVSSNKADRFKVAAEQREINNQKAKQAWENAQARIAAMGGYGGPQKQTLGNAEAYTRASLEKMANPYYDPSKARDVLNPYQDDKKNPFGNWAKPNFKGGGKPPTAKDVLKGNAAVDPLTGKRYWL